MAKETLVVPEERLEDVIKVIRCGLIHLEDGEVHDDTERNLLNWCSEQEEYLKRLAEE